MITRRAVLGAGAGLGVVALARGATRPAELKPDLVVLAERPFNAETPAHLLDEDFTSARYMFVRNNGLVPNAIDAATWTLEIGGEACLEPRAFALAELQSDYSHHAYALTLECGGNGRSEFFPPVPGNQWTTGAVSCALWRGVRLRDLLNACGIAENAVYVGYYGRDRHLSGDPDKVVISRGVPIDKALQDETLVAFEMNGEPIPLLHGGPLRLVAGGWPASASGKWLYRLVIRDRVHDGAKMGGNSYRVPCEPVAPGVPVADEDLCIIESMPVKSLITWPKSGARHPVGDALQVRGHAWAGEFVVKRVLVSTDFGQTWQSSALSAPVNRLAWQRFSTPVQFQQPGYFEVWCRAEDKLGRSQPMVLPGWNPKGYLNNACHRIAVQVA
ncbi:MAG: sulfite oxidase [Gammaproteobacteria bacterium]|nr:sulfite oxidase [Gammaproteobacteria bacterium]